VRRCLLVVTVLHMVSETGKTGRCKRMENCQEKDACGDRVERLDLHTHREIGSQCLISG
jgi:hypothetical protein